MAPDRSTLYRLYHEEGYSLPQVAAEYDVSTTTAWRWLDSADIERRTVQEASNQHHRENRAVYRSQAVEYGTDAEGYERWRHRDGERRQAVKVHRLVCVAEYGVDALKGHVVHHVNGVPWDNRPENLEVLTPEQHRALHAEDEVPA